MFDVDRVISTLTLVERPSFDETDEPSGQLVLGVEEGGLLAVESLILARYYMFEQVYFHKVRRYLDLQYSAAMKKIAAGRLLPPTDIEGLRAFFKMDDMSVQSELREASAKGNEAARRLISRETMKVGFEVKVAERSDDISAAELILREAGIEFLSDRDASKASQKFSTSNIFILGETSFTGVRPISEHSHAATAIPDNIFLGRIFVSHHDRDRIKRERMFNGLLAQREKGKKDSE